MNDIKRYEWDYGNDEMSHDLEGEYVTFDDYEKRVNGQLRLLEVSGRYNEKLEARIAELEESNKQFKTGLNEVVRVASFHPVDKVIYKIAFDALVAGA